MKPNLLHHPLAKLAAAALLAAAIGSAAHAQNLTASDNASDTNYPGGNWTTGSNGGQGFGPWNLYGTGSHGHFVGNSTLQGFGDVNSDGSAFGMWGNPAGDNYSNAERPFVAPLAAGQSFSIQLATAYRNGAKGISLFSGTDFATEIWNFNVGGDQYSAGGTNLDWAYAQDSVFTLTANQTSSGILEITLARGSEIVSQTVNGTLGGIRLYVGSTDGGIDLNNLFFNNLQILGDPEPPSAPVITSASSANGTAGVDFEYQTTVTPSLPTTYNATGLPAGLSINSSTGLISGTPSASGNSTVTIVATNSEGGSGDFTLSLEIAPPALPVITSAWGAIAVRDTPFSYQIQASPSGVPTTYNATSLPPGFTLDSATGLVTGNASTYGTLGLYLSATNESGTGEVEIVFVYVGSATDMASNYSPGNWIEGSNLSLGTGFGNWTFTSNGTAGTFLGDPFLAGITGAVDPSFGLYANPENSGASIEAGRDLTSPLAAGDTLSFQWGVNWDSGNADGSKGFVLYAGTDEAIVVNIGDNSTITLNSVDTGMAYGSVAMNWDFTQTSNTSVSITASQRDGSSTSYTTSVVTSGPLTGMKFYARGLNAGEFSDNRQPYFNFFLITPGSSPEPSAYNSWAAEYSLDPAVTTGPGAGAPEADPDSDSFTNQQEYAFGTNPTEATAGLVGTSNSGGDLIITFLTRSDLAYTVQTTDNLSTTPFDNSGIPIVDGPVEPAPPTGYIRKQFSVTPGAGRNFYRVIARDLPPG